MNTFHLSLDVPDLNAAVAFYRDLFGQEPARRKRGYAKFELADPPVAIALQESRRAALSQLGIRLESPAAFEVAEARLRRSGLADSVERDTTCCYARQDKVWVKDPAGNPWEVYAVIEDVEDDALATCCEGGRA